MLKQSALTLSLAVLSLMSFATMPSLAERPNIILILCDDLGYADVGFNGSKDIRTPNLDQLANGGTVFTSAYVAHPFCGPSRMGLMTGRYPHQFGSPYNLPNSGNGIEEYNRHGIDVKERLISSVLQDSGYFTGAIGKWHMGITADYHPNNRGFDEYYGFLGGGHKYFPDQFRGIYERQKKRGIVHFNEYIVPLEHNGKQVDEKEYLTDGLSREAVGFLQLAKKKNKPFFLYLAYNAPHSPLEATEKDFAEFANIKDDKRRTYAAMVYAVDRGVGRIVDTLKANDQYDNTLIVFLSDNGGKLGLGANNDPLSQGKGSTYEGGYRVPMFFHFPKQLPRQATYDYPVTALDFYPTFAMLAGAKLPPGKKLDGIDVWDAVRNGTDPQAERMIFAMRHRDGFSDVGARRGNWKITRAFQAPWKLFDLSKDIGERHDLSASHGALVRELVEQAHQWSENHTQPKWFDNLSGQKKWEAARMPRHHETFSLAGQNNR